MNKIDFFNKSFLSYRWSWMEKMANLGYFDINTDRKGESIKEMMTSLNTIYPDRWSFK